MKIYAHTLRTHIATDVKKKRRGPPLTLDILQSNTMPNLNSQRVGPTLTHVPFLTLFRNTREQHGHTCGSITRIHYIRCKEKKGGAERVPTNPIFHESKRQTSTKIQQKPSRRTSTNP